MRALRGRRTRLLIGADAWAGDLLYRLAPARASERFSVLTRWARNRRRCLDRKTDMADDKGNDWQPAEKPSARDALVLLAASAVCAGLFYLRLRELWPSLFYGALTGCALAAIGAEFFKFIRSYRSENGTGSTSAALRALIGQSFRIGFISTFTKILRELFKLVGIKLAVALVIALSALFVAGQHHLF